MSPVSTTDPDCLFCGIVAGTIPSRQLYADEHAVAFLDIGAWHRGHTLVVPRRHVPDLLTGDPAMAELGPAIDAVARMLVDRLDADGLAGQEVLHLHVHLVPRYANAPGLAHLVSPGPVPDAELDAVFAQLTDPA